MQAAASVFDFLISPAVLLSSWDVKYPQWCPSCAMLRAAVTDKIEKLQYVLAAVE
jgi:hypothetical protein